MTVTMRLLLVCALLATVPAQAADEPLPVPPVSRWSTLPRVEFRPNYKPRPTWVERAQALEETGECSFTPDAQGIVRIDVQFVVIFDPKGANLGAHADPAVCPALGALVEQFAGQLGPSIVVLPKDKTLSWRRSRFLAGWKK